MARVASAARKTLDLSIPYISCAGVDILTSDLKANCRRGLQVRLLALLTSAHLEQNRAGALRLAERFQWAGARVEIRSPTDAQAQQTGAIAALHAKLTIADRLFTYQGTGNVSLAAFHRAFEVGNLIRGPESVRLWKLYDWVYQRHEIWVDPQSEAAPA